MTCLLNSHSSLCCLGSPKTSSHIAMKEPKSHSHSASLSSDCDSETDGFKARKFALADLVAATESFKDENFLGEGGFGRVYKGHLKDTGEVKIK